MPNFNRVFSCDPGFLLEELERHPELWNKNLHRRWAKASPHKATDDIWLLFPALGRPEEMIASLEVVPYPAWQVLPAAREIVLGLAKQQGALRIGRSVITRLPPGEEITLHSDSDPTVGYYQRFQVSLACEETCLFEIAGEARWFASGTIWQVDVSKPHRVKNAGAKPRLTLIVDLHLAGQDGKI